MTLWTIIYGGSKTLYFPKIINFVKFLQIIGTKITLEGFTGFRAGLDVKGNSTGVHSVYTSHRSYQIMFHVSTMLPFSNGKPKN